MNKHQHWEENRDIGEKLLASVKQMKTEQAAKEHKVNSAYPQSFRE